MKLSFLQGKAAVIAGLEVGRAMSVFGVPGGIPEIQEIKVGPARGVHTDSVKKQCIVKVIFWDHFYMEITFWGIRSGVCHPQSEVDRPNIIHWFVARVVTHYYGQSLESSFEY